MSVLIQSYNGKTSERTNAGKIILFHMQTFQLLLEVYPHFLHSRTNGFTFSDIVDTIFFLFHFYRLTITNAAKCLLYVGNENEESWSGSLALLKYAGTSPAFTYKHTNINNTINSRKFLQ